MERLIWFNYNNRICDVKVNVNRNGKNHQIPTENRLKRPEPQRTSSPDHEVEIIDLSLLNQQEFDNFLSGLRTERSEKNKSQKPVLNENQTTFEETAPPLFVASDITW